VLFGITKELIIIHIYTKMNIYSSDRAILRALVERKNRALNKSLNERVSDQNHWGLLFSELFHDINPSLSFSSYAGEVYVHMDRKTLPHSRDVRKETYMRYNLTEVCQIQVQQRLLLLRQLEEERLILWVNEGTVPETPDTYGKLFFLINKEDKEFVERRVNYEAVATDELMTLVKNGFKSKEDIRYRWSFTMSWIGIAVALLIGILQLPCCK